MGSPEITIWTTEKCCFIYSCTLLSLDTVSRWVLIQCIAEQLFEEKSIQVTRLHSCWHVEKPWQEEMIKFSDPFSQPNHPLDSTTVWKPRPKIHFEPVAKILVFVNLWWKYSPLHSVDYKYSLFIHISHVSEYLIEDPSPRICGFHYKRKKNPQQKVAYQYVLSLWRDWRVRYIGLQLDHFFP